MINCDPDPDSLRFYRGRLLDAGWSEPPPLCDALRRSEGFRQLPK